MLPRNWPLVVCEKTQDQFEVVRKILNSPRGRQRGLRDGRRPRGRAHLPLHLRGGAVPTSRCSRLWISSLTPEAIRDGFAALRDGRDYDPLADAARGRSRADWLVGMNLSRAYTLACDEELSVGRVQTPTLAMLVERELAIRDFVPEDYLEVVATFSPRAGRRALQGHLVPRPERRADEDAAQPAAAAGRRGGRARSSSARATGQARHRIDRSARRSGCRRRCSTI